MSLKQNNADSKKLGSGNEDESYFLLYDIIDFED